MPRKSSLSSSILILALLLTANWGATAQTIGSTHPYPTSLSTQHSALSTHGYDPYGGWAELPIANPDGYFRTAVVSGISWLVTPAGHAFYSVGLNVVGYSGNPVKFESYDQRMFDKYHDVNAWATATSAQMRDWGMNTIGGFSGREITDYGLAETRVLRLAATSMNAPYNVRHANGFFPDVFDPAFAPAVTAIATATISPADASDQWLIGYYLDNELCWYKDCYWRDDQASTLSENFIALPAAAAGKQSWVNLLYVRYSTIAALNAAWGTSYASFGGPEPNSLLNTAAITATAAIPLKYDFLSLIAQQYYQVTTTAVHERDPHHLVLSDRFVGVPPYREIMQQAGQYCDIIAVNIYDDVHDNLVLGEIDEAARWSGKPVIISEYGFRATTSGMANLPHVKGELVTNDQDRAAAYHLMMNEAIRRPAIIGAHWFMLADNPVQFDPILSGHYSWGFLDIDGNPYAELTDRAAAFNAEMYRIRLNETPDASPPPSPLSPMYNAPVFSPQPSFQWRPVVGVSTYTWQAARSPSFSPAYTSFPLTVTTFVPDTALEPGRWYWRVRVNSAVSESLAYSAPSPFYVLQKTAALTVNNMETLPDVTIQGQGPDYRWTAEVQGDMTMTATHGFGVTEGQQAALITFSGQTNGQADHFGWANLNRYPNGTSFTPRDWTSYNWLTADFSYAGAEQPAPRVGFGFGDDAGKGGGTSLPIRTGTTQVALSIDAAVARGMNPAAVASLGIGMQRPLTGTQLVVDNITLRRTAHDAVYQPPITPSVSDAAISGTLLLDWQSYQPATTTVSYLVYVTDTANTPIGTFAPVLKLDAVSQSTRLRVLLKPGAPEADANGYTALANGKLYYVTIVPVDYWGNSGAIGPSIASSPSECGQSFGDVPPNLWAAVFINHLACLHILSGVGGGQFQPNGQASREQFAKMITLARGWPIVTPTAPTFSDVPTTNPLYAYIETAVAHNAISGYDANTCSARGLAYPCFLPHTPISRAQLTIILVRSYGWVLDISGGPHFSDVPTTAFGYAQIETCYHRGIVSGVGGGQFQPSGNITRAQLAKMLYNAIRQP